VATTATLPKTTSTGWISINLSFLIPVADWLGLELLGGLGLDSPPEELATDAASSFEREEEFQKRNVMVKKC
jgi:hypothetical protein